jgi:hypothetical protein
MPYATFHNKLEFFYGDKLLAPHPNPQAGGPPCYFYNIFAATFHTASCLLHLKPKDVPSLGNKGPTKHGIIIIKLLITTLLTKGTRLTTVLL